MEYQIFAYAVVALGVVIAVCGVVAVLVEFTGLLDRWFL
jgi:hypothetical protein